MSASLELLLAPSNPPIWAGDYSAPSILYFGQLEPLKVFQNTHGFGLRSRQRQQRKKYAVYRLRATRLESALIQRPGPQIKPFLCVSIGKGNTLFSSTTSPKAKPEACFSVAPTGHSHPAITTFQQVRLLGKSWLLALMQMHGGMGAERRPSSCSPTTWTRRASSS